MQNTTVSRELASKFSGYKVLGYNADLSMVCLMDANREVFTYSFEASDKGTVIPERIKPCTLAAAIEVADGAEPLVISMNELLRDVADNEGAQVKSLSATVSQLTADLAGANAKITALEAKETERRKKAIRAAINAAIAEYNECAAEDERVAENLCDDVAEDEYAECEADGEFCGDERARACALARCAEAALKARKAKKNALADEHKVVWGLSKHDDNNDALSDALKAINNE